MKHFGIKKVLDTFSGGQKIVYIVEDNEGRILAMKCFRNCSQRDIQEIALLEKFKDLSGISKIVRVEEYEGSPVLFEEFIEAPNLDAVATDYAGNAEKVCALMIGVAEILQPIWEARIVHRDLKPTNIKILPSGAPVILDFGIARDLSANESITDTGEDQPMTWNFASPEQYKKDKDAISYRTDFFVMGVIGFALYHGTHPFGTSKDEVAARFNGQDNSINSPQDCVLNPFFEATLAFDPALRPRSVEALLTTLK